MRNRLICICGKSGSGKSTITKMFSELDDQFKIIDVDKIGHLSLKIGFQKLVETFGEEILTFHEIDRKKLGNIVFHDKKAMQKLEDITWPIMEKEIDKIISQDGYYLLDYQLLPKTKYFKEANLRILVTSPYQERLNRVVKRDLITEEQFQEREDASLDFQEQDFHYVIENKEEEETRKEIKRIYEESIIYW